MEFDHPVANAVPRRSGKTWTWFGYDECANTPNFLERGDRVRIKEGYECSGQVGYYVGKQVDLEGFVIVDGFPGADSSILAAAIEPYPYSREERIERAIADFEDSSTAKLTTDEYALLFAILDAGI